MSVDQVMEHGDEAMQVFVRPKVEGQDLARRIIDRSHQIVRSPIGEPREGAAIDQH